MGKGQVFKMYLFGKNRAKAKPEQNGSDYGPTPYKEPSLSGPPGRAKATACAARIKSSCKYATVSGGGERLS
jgi:hypothetical protein